MAGGLVERSELEAPAPTTEPGIIPVEYATQIIQEAAKSSMALSTFRQVRMPTRVHQLPVLDVLPVATWVTGEPSSTDGTGGEKAATSQQWKGVSLTAEEIAAIVVIPEAVLEDASINLWAEITPRIAESIGKAIDAAAFEGTNAPASWGNGIIPDATTAGHDVVQAGTPTADDFNAAFGFVEADGYMVNQVYAKTATRAALRGLDASGVPVYLADLRDDGRTDAIYGVPIDYDMLGAFEAATHAVVGDRTKAIIGVRTDMQVRVLREATIDVSAAQDGSALVNLAAQDSVGLRVRARFGFAVANPVTHLQPTAAQRYPFACITTL